MPAITIGVGECVGAGESGTPGGPLPVDTELARHLAHSLVASEFDPAFSLRLQVDHGITHSLQYLVPSLDVPIVPRGAEHVRPAVASLRAATCRGASGRAVARDGAGKRVVGDRLRRAVTTVAVAEVVRHVLRRRPVPGGGVGQRPGVPGASTRTRRRSIIRAAQPKQPRLRPAVPRPARSRPPHEIVDYETTASRPRRQRRPEIRSGSPWPPRSAGHRAPRGLRADPAWLTGMAVAAVEPATS